MSPQPARNLALATHCSASSWVVGVAVLRETFDTTISTADDRSRMPRKALHSSVQSISTRTHLRDPLITELKGHAPRVESFRVLRTNLQFIDVDNESKVVVVTSSVPEEGKSTTAVQRCADHGSCRRDG